MPMIARHAASRRSAFAHRDRDARLARRRRRRRAARSARAGRCCRPSPAATLIQDLFFVFYHAGAGAVLEPARRLCRAGLGRPAGLRRARRLSAVRAHASSAASIRCSRSCSPALVAALLALPTALRRVPPARRLFRHRHLGGGRGLSGWCSRSSSSSAAAPAPRCRRPSPTTCSASNGSKALFGVRTPAARDIVTYWLALALAVGTILRHLSACCARAAAWRSPRSATREAAADSVGVDSYPHQALGLCR